MLILFYNYPVQTQMYRQCKREVEGCAASVPHPPSVQCPGRRQEKSKVLVFITTDKRCVQEPHWKEWSPLLATPSEIMQFAQAELYSTV